MTIVVNPKTAAGAAKPPLHLLEHVADVEIARALGNGAHRYGRKNFYLSPVPASVYVGALRRHVGQWSAGEDCASDSGLHHLAHIGACIHVLFAAIEAGTFVDDRGASLDEQPASAHAEGSVAECRTVEEPTDADASLRAAMLVGIAGSAPGALDDLREERDLQREREERLARDPAAGLADPIPAKKADDGSVPIPYHGLDAHHWSPTP